jgi:multidrug efflux pump subunit AcrB
VDDAIVVVENVERNLAEGLAPRDATIKAMQEVGGALVAIALVLGAVFVPTAFISGISGQFYRQFALTIAVATAFSAFVSLTLSPALCRILLQPHGAKRDWFARVWDYSLGWFFRLFNRGFDAASRGYGGLVAGVTRRSAIVLILYLGLLALTVFGFVKVPSGFIPAQDQGYLIVIAQLLKGFAYQKRQGCPKDHRSCTRSRRRDVCGGICGFRCCLGHQCAQQGRALHAPRSLRRARQERIVRSENPRRPSCESGHNR